MMYFPSTIPTRGLLACILVISACLRLRFSPWFNNLESQVQQSTPVASHPQSSSRAGKSAIFRHPIPHGYHGSSIRNRHVIVPQLTFEEYHNIPSSAEELILERGKHLVVMYKVEHNGGTMIRYTKRETVPYWKSIITFDRVPVNVKSLLRKRGHTVRPTPPEAGKHEQFEKEKYNGKDPQFNQPKQYMSWNWNRKAGSSRPTIIPLCYVNKNAYDQLDKYFKPAIQEWHTVLGAKRGVEFRLYAVNEHHVCSNYQIDSAGSVVFDDECWDDNHVRIHWASPAMNKGTYTTTVGFHWDEEIQMHIETHAFPSDASGYSGSTEVIIHNIVHELGHVLGLHHEHQRPQAMREIDFDWKQLPDYETAMIKLYDYNEDKGNFKTDSVIVLAEVGEDAGLAEKLVREGVFKGTRFEVIDQYATYYSQEHSYDNDRTDDWVELAAHIDFDSVMMYESAPEQLRVDIGVKPVMRRKGSKGGEGMWGINLHPSVGDVAAVKSLYPDLV